VGIRGRLLANAAAVGLNALAAAAFVLLAATSARTAGYVLAGIALAGVALLGISPSRTMSVVASGRPAVVGDRLVAMLVPQVLLAAGLLVALHAAVPESTAAVVVTGLLLLLVIANQAILADTIHRPTITVTNLPGYQAGRALIVPAGVVFGLAPALVLVVGVFAAASLPPWPLAVIVAVATGLIGVVGAQALGARLRGVRSEVALSDAMRRFDPAFALHFSAPDNTEYHVTMWLPYLERIGRRWFILTREPGPFEVLSRRAPAGVPVVFCPVIEHVDDVVTAGLKAVFYVNNGMKNSHMVRFHDLTHIQLLHGDSDKASSYNPVTAMFDRIFVAGEAAIDRYAAHGVVIPREKFDIVGRPQVESIKVGSADISGMTAPVVLYATTWTSHYEDANYCSLPIGERIVASLLRCGATVIMRPHPYTERSAASARHLLRLQQMLAADREQTGRPHVYGPPASAMSLLDCVNQSDAMISDVSGVASDYLYSAKPFALTNMRGDTPDSFEASFPLARAAYVIDAGAPDLDGALERILDDLLRDDPLAATRRDMRTYYLGDFPPDSYADGFVRTARRYTE